MAKGGAIILVVLHHCVIHLWAQDLVHSAYTVADHFLKQMRMPLFLLASGIATSFLYRRSGREFVARKIVPIAWLLVVWTVVLSGFFSLVEGEWDGSLAGLLGFGGGILRSLALPEGQLWFVWVLGILSGAAFLSRSLPPLALLAGCSALTLASDVANAAHFAMFPQSLALANLIDYALLFFLGLVGRQVIIRWAERTDWVILGMLVGGAIFIALNVCSYCFSVVFDWTHTLRALTGAALALGGAVLVSRQRHASTVLAWFGQRSLQIFLGHGLILVPLCAALGRIEDAPAIWSMVLPLLMTVCAVGGALLVHAGLSALGLGAVYGLPRAMVTAWVVQVFEWSHRFPAREAVRRLFRPHGRVLG